MREERQTLTLVTEGGYPFSSGGVSVWCDQLVHAVPDMAVEVVALTAGRDPRPLFRLPEHVRTVSTVPLWSPAAAGRAPRGRARHRFRDLYSELLAAVLAPAQRTDEVVSALRGLFEFAQTQNLGAALLCEGVALLADAWRGHPPGLDDAGVVAPIRPSLADAALVTTWIEHMLRPLSAPVATGDLVHCSSNGLSGLVALAAKWSRGTPFIVSEHGIYLRERYLAYQDTEYGWAVKFTVLRLTRAITSAVYAEADVIAPGNLYNQRWERVCGADVDGIKTVYNGVDPWSFSPTTSEPESPTVVYVGRIDPLKDLETLLRAFVIIHARMPHARLRIFGAPGAGREDYLQRCRSLCRELGLDGVATFEGRASSASAAYAAGHVIALTSISEGFPYTVIEAMSSGRATVSTDVGGVAEAVGDAGLVVPARNPQAVADACLQLLTNADLRALCGRQARERVLQLFTLERSMAAFRDMYAAVLDVAASRGGSRDVSRSVDGSADATPTRAMTRSA